MAAPGSREQQRGLQRWGFVMVIGLGAAGQGVVACEGGCSSPSKRQQQGTPPMNILTVNLLLSTLVFAIAARIYLPNLKELLPRTVLIPILLLHSLRHLGLMFLAPGAVYPGMPKEFAYPAALGDLLAAVLALIALVAVIAEARRARFFVWLFNIEGSLDLIAAITLATVLGAAPTMGPAYWIPAFWVPALLVTHYITFALLMRKARAPA